MAQRRKKTGVKCPHCRSLDTELLPGGVVYECKDPECGFTFTEGQAKEIQQQREGGG